MPPGFDFEGYRPVCPGVPGNCAPVILVLTICPPNSTTSVSTYNGAPITVRDANGNIIFSGFVPATGRVVVGTVVSGNPITVQVGAVLQPVAWPFATVLNIPNPAPSDFIEMAGFTANLVVPCTFDTGAGLNQVTELTLTPPPGVIRGYVVAGCTSLNIPRVRELQLWIPQSPNNQGGTYLNSFVTNNEGYFEFNGLNPCIAYELKIIQGSVVTVTVGVLAGAETATIGTPGAPQKYILSDATGAICNVLPDPP